MTTLSERAMRVALTGAVPEDDPHVIADMQAEIERLRALADAYRDYAILLEGAESRLLSLAHVHGYRTPPDGVERGKNLRAKIDRLNQQQVTGPK